MVIVNKENTYYNVNEVKHQGYYLDGYLKDNLDNFLIKAVKNKWDGVVLITGMEGSGKSTGAFTYANYVDPTFPGELLNDGTLRRDCNRIVFSPEQFMEVVDKSKPGQAIVWDEFVLGGLSTDAMSNMQRVIIKKMVTIRKKGLYIFLVIPSIFLLRKYFALLRTRALIHFYTPDGVKRGYFKFYNYGTKNKLYIKGIKEFNHGVVRPEFKGRATNTEGYYFNIEEYDTKKEKTILELTQAPDKQRKALSRKYQDITILRNKVINELYQIYNKEYLTNEGKKLTVKHFTEIFNKKFECDLHSETMSRLTRELERTNQTNTQ